MTQFDKFKSLFDEVGIVHREGPRHRPDRSGAEPGTRLTVDASGSGEKVHGYACFFADFDFDERGAFLRMGIWE